MVEMERIQELINETVAAMERAKEEAHQATLRHKELEEELRILRVVLERITKYGEEIGDRPHTERLTILERLEQDFPEERIGGMSPEDALRLIAENWPGHITLTPVRQHLVNLGIVPPGQEGSILVHDILNSGEYVRLKKKGHYRLKSRRNSSDSSQGAA